MYDIFDDHNEDMEEPAAQAEASQDAEIEEGKGKSQQEKQKAETNKLKMLEEALGFSYEFRFNVILGLPEFRRVEEDEEAWRRMDDYTLNSIVRELKHDGITWASRARVGETIESDFATLQNPIQEYFKRLSLADNHDYIGELVRTVTPVAGAKMFRTFFEKWLVAAVANVFITDRCANHTIFILTGSQGAFKSTWVRNLCPKALTKYYYEGDLDPENKDDLFATTANLIYNLDDYLANVTKKKINALKSFITKNVVKARRPYSRYPEDLPKICSFIGSSNEQTFLYDSTGSRRFLPFEATAIDIKAAQKVDMDKVWAQAYRQFRKGFVYWLTKEEEQQLREYNQQFEVVSFEYELVAKYFRMPKERDKAEAHLTNSDIITWLEDKTRKPLVAKRLGDALKEQGFERWQLRVGGYARKWVYSVDFATDAEIQSATQYGS